MNLGSAVPRRPRHSAIAYTIRHRARMVIACLIAGVLVFLVKVAAATWFNIYLAVQTWFNIYLAVQERREK